MYSPTVMDHFEHPRNGGKPPNFNTKGVAGNPSAGPYMVLYLDIRKDRIEGVGFQTYGCPSAIAAGSLMTEMIKGKSRMEAAAIDSPGLIESLGGLPLGKRHCADLAVSALRDALGQAPLETEEGTSGEEISSR